MRGAAADGLGRLRVRRGIVDVVLEHELTVWQERGLKSDRDLEARHAVDDLYIYITLADVREAKRRWPDEPTASAALLLGRWQPAQDWVWARATISSALRVLPAVTSEASIALRKLLGAVPKLSK